jgi:26S proteasome regulatory subunit T6
LKDELAYLQEPSSYVGEVVKLMGKTKVLVKVGQDGKYICKIDKNIDINKLVAGTRVALRSDSYALYKILPTKVCYILTWFGSWNSFSEHCIRFVRWTLWLA